MSDAKIDEWAWWAGADGEYFSVGPCATKEAALAEAIADEVGAHKQDGVLTLTICICEAKNPPLKLSNWVEAETILERSDEHLACSDRVGHEFDEGPWFECSPEQLADLSASIKQACDDWQSHHKLKFTCGTFCGMRSEETIVMSLPSEGGAA